MKLLTHSDYHLLIETFYQNHIRDSINNRTSHLIHPQQKIVLHHEFFVHNYIDYTIDIYSDLKIPRQKICLIQSYKDKIPFVTEFLFDADDFDIRTRVGIISQLLLETYSIFYSKLEKQEISHCHSGKYSRGYLYTGYLSK